MSHTTYISKLQQVDSSYQTLDVIKFKPKNTSLLEDVCKAFKLITPKEFHNLEEALSTRPNSSLFGLVKNNKVAWKYVMDRLPKEPELRRAISAMYENDFMPVPCIKWVETQGNICYHISINQSIQLTIINDEPIESKDINIIVRVIKWISVIANSKAKLNLYIFLTPFTKRIVRRNQLLTRNEINSGVSYRYGEWIQLFRKEELLKVLIHELIHYYELDVQNADWIDDVDEIIKVNPVCHSVLVNEAVTEAMALYLHTMLYAEYTGAQFDDALNKEITHSRSMFYLVLYHYDIADMKQLQHVCQYTNVISYYLIKYMLVKNKNLFYQLVDRKNIKQIIIQCINELLSYKLNDYQSIMNQVFSQYTYHFSSRMTVLDLNLFKR